MIFIPSLFASQKQQSPVDSRRKVSDLRLKQDLKDFILFFREEGGSEEEEQLKQKTHQMKIEVDLPVDSVI